MNNAAVNGHHKPLSVLSLSLLSVVWGVYLGVDLCQLKTNTDQVFCHLKGFIWEKRGLQSSACELIGGKEVKGTELER